MYNTKRINVVAFRSEVRVSCANAGLRRQIVLHRINLQNWQTIGDSPSEGMLLSVGLERMFATRSVCPRVYGSNALACDVDISVHEIVWK